MDEIASLSSSYDSKQSFNNGLENFFEEDGDLDMELDENKSDLRFTWENKTS